MVKTDSKSITLGRFWIVATVIRSDVFFFFFISRARDTRRRTRCSSRMVSPLEEMFRLHEYPA